MSRDCGFEQKDLTKLFEEYADTQAPVERRPKRAPVALGPEQALDILESVEPVWISAGSLPASGHVTPVPIRPALFLRDAVAAVGRVFSDRDEPVPVITHWGPSITPQLLEAAARFAGHKPPWVTVFMTKGEGATDPLVAFADWTCGSLVETDSDQPQSRRTAMLQVRYRCAIFLGGGDDVRTDATELASHQLHAAPGAKRRLFAVASTGGAAAEVFRQESAAYGGGLPGVELERPTSYTVLMKRILDLTLPSPPGGPRGSRSGTGGGGGRGGVGIGARAPTSVVLPSLVQG